MDEILQDLSATSLVNAIEANVFALFPLFGHWPQCEIHDEPDMLWSMTHIPFPLFNSVLRTHLPPDKVEAAIEAAQARCRARNVPLLWWTGPTTQPADLGSHLAAHGFQAEESPGMAADLRSLPETLPSSTGLIIKQVTDMASAEKWCRVLCIGFEMPDFVGEAFLDFMPGLHAQPWL